MKTRVPTAKDWWNAYMKVRYRPGIPNTPMDILAAMVYELDFICSQPCEDTTP